MREGCSILVLREMPESLQGLMGGQLELVWHGQDGDSILSFDGVAQVKHG